AKHIVLVHGSPMAGQSLHRAGAELAKRVEGVTVWVPDLPGFGASRQELADYSFLAHSFHLEEFLDRMNIPAAHFVAYSQGGGVVLSLLERSSDKAFSVSLVSAIGVQELELLGRYGANHAIHGLQLLLFKGFETLLPHFGLFDGLLLNSRYARNFYDSDQRPLRAILQSIELPTLIIHGRDDSLVPYAVAMEHHRLVPQSELVSLSGGHGLVMQATEKLMAALVGFIRSIDSGEPKSKQFAVPERLLAAEQAFDRAALPPPGGIAVLIAGLGVILFSYVTEDLAAIAAGIMAAAGTFSLFQAIVFTFLGIYSGDMLVFLSGRWLRRTRGEAAFKHPRLQRGEQWFKKRSTTAIVLARFVPGSRFAVFFAAGALGVSFRLFSVLLIVPALIWTPALVGLAYLAGEQTLRFFQNYSQYALPAAIGLALAFWVLMQLITLSVNRKARRRAYGRFMRIRHWEFWPRWAFYPPVFLYVCYLGMRFRSLSLFTLANPAIEAGGFVGESKSQILAGLDPAVVPAWALLDVTD
ncbi:MAG: alpha/beta fold hydrolase, partial [Pseudomonadota bacterium]